jgi:hypothetical protein
MPAYVSETDPGAIGAGKAWWKESTHALQIRDNANENWIAVGEGTSPVLYSGSLQDFAYNADESDGLDAYLEQGKCVGPLATQDYDAGTVTLPDDTANIYVYVDEYGTLSAFTTWQPRMRLLHMFTTALGEITDNTDCRGWVTIDTGDDTLRFVYADGLDIYLFGNGNPVRINDTLYRFDDALYMLTLTDATDNYVQIEPSGALATDEAWLEGCIPLFIVTCADAGVSNVVHCRPFLSKDNPQGAEGDAQYKSVASAGQSAFAGASALNFGPDGDKVGFFGAPPVAVDSGWEVTNGVTLTEIDVSTVSDAELRQFVGTMAQRLIDLGIFSGAQ